MKHLPVINAQATSSTLSRSWTDPTFNFITVFHWWSGEGEGGGGKGEGRIQVPVWTHCARLEKHEIGVVFREQTVPDMIARIMIRCSEVFVFKKKVVLTVKMPRTRTYHISLKKFLGRHFHGTSYHTLDLTSIISPALKYQGTMVCLIFFIQNMNRIFITTKLLLKHDNHESDIFPACVRPNKKAFIEPLGME